tara:strand:- start:101 stop:211 length:111 start_codon:yes stop_codon:yes gene_type:complete
VVIIVVIFIEIEDYKKVLMYGINRNGTKYVGDELDI